MAEEASAAGRDHWEGIWEDGKVKAEDGNWYTFEEWQQWSLEQGFEDAKYTTALDGQDRKWFGFSEEEWALLDKDWKAKLGCRPDGLWKPAYWVQKHWHMREKQERIKRRERVPEEPDSDEPVEKWRKPDVTDRRYAPEIIREAGPSMPRRVPLDWPLECCCGIKHTKEFEKAWMKVTKALENDAAWQRQEQLRKGLMLVKPLFSELLDKRALSKYWKHSVWVVLRLEWNYDVFHRDAGYTGDCSAAAVARYKALLWRCIQTMVLEPMKGKVSLLKVEEDTYFFEVPIDVGPPSAAAKEAKKAKEPKDKGPSSEAPAAEGGEAPARAAKSREARERRANPELQQSMKQQGDSAASALIFACQLCRMIPKFYQFLRRLEPERWKERDLTQGTNPVKKFQLSIQEGECVYTGDDAMGTAFEYAERGVHTHTRYPAAPSTATAFFDTSQYGDFVWQCHWTTVRLVSYLKGTGCSPDEVKAREPLARLYRDVCRRRHAEMILIDPALGHEIKTQHNGSGWWTNFLCRGDQKALVKEALGEMAWPAAGAIARDWPDLRGQQKEGVVLACCVDVTMWDRDKEHRPKFFEGVLKTYHFMRVLAEICEATVIRMSGSMGIVFWPLDKCSAENKGGIMMLISKFIVLLYQYTEEMNDSVHMADRTRLRICCGLDELVLDSEGLCGRPGGLVATPELTKIIRGAKDWTACQKTLFTNRLTKYVKERYGEAWSMITHFQSFSMEGHVESLERTMADRAWPGCRCRHYDGSEEHCGACRHWEEFPKFKPPVDVRALKGKVAEPRSSSEESDIEPPSGAWRPPRLEEPPADAPEDDIDYCRDNKQFLQWAVKEALKAPPTSSDGVRAAAERTELLLKLWAQKAREPLEQDRAALQRAAARWKAGDIGVSQRREICDMTKALRARYALQRKRQMVRRKHTRDGNAESRPLPQPRDAEGPPAAAPEDLYDVDEERYILLDRVFPQGQDRQRLRELVSKKQKAVEKYNDPFTAVRNRWVEEDFSVFGKRR